MEQNDVRESEKWNKTTCVRGENGTQRRASEGENETKRRASE